MINSLEVLGEGCKVIVLRIADLEEESTKINIDNLKNVYKELNIINCDSPFTNIIILYTYFCLFRHLHFYSYIFLKNSVIKIVKKNEIKNLNITLQNNWVKRLSYNESKIFDNSFFPYNNFVVFHPYFAENIRKTVDIYYDNKRKNRKKIITNERNSNKIIEKKFSNIKNLKNYKISTRNVLNLKNSIWINFKRLSNNILQYVIPFFCRTPKKNNKEKTKKKYMFKEIYNYHNFIYCNNSKENDFGYLEENLFFIPSYIWRNKKNKEIYILCNPKKENKNEKYLIDIMNKKETQKNVSRYKNENGVLNSLMQNINRAYGLDKISNNNVFNNNDNKEIEKMVDKFISIELKLKCGISDYKNMYDRYNIQQLIKKKNKNIKYPSLYIPSNFFNLHYWDILTNLNYIFLFKSNNINFYINNNKYRNTSQYFFNYLNNFFSYFSIYLLIKDSSYFYFNYLNEYRKRNTSNFIFTRNFSFTSNSISTSDSLIYSLDKIEKNIYKKEIENVRDKINNPESKNNYIDYKNNSFTNENFIIPMQKNKQNSKYFSHNHEIKKYNKKEYNFQNISKYAYKNYIFSNYYYIKYITSYKWYNNMEVLFSREKEYYYIFFNKLLYVLFYKNIYGNITPYFHKYLTERKTRYAINENNVKKKVDCNIQKEPIYKKYKLTNFKYFQIKGEYENTFNLYNAFYRSSFFFIHLFNLFFIKKKQPIRKDNKYYMNKYSNMHLFKKKRIKIKKHYKKFYNVYKKVSKKLKKKVSIGSKNELEFKKNAYKEIKEKAKKNFLYKINKILYCLYHKKFNKNYFYYVPMLHKLTIKKFINDGRYLVIHKIKEIKILFQNKIYKQVNEKIICFFKKLNKIFLKKKKIGNYEISDTKEIVENIDFIKNVHHNSLKIKKNPFEINKNNEHVIILSTIIRKEKYLFYKLLYFQCFNAGQIQLIYCMMKFIKIFENIFDVKKSDEFFSNFKYYKKSLYSIFNAHTNYYFKKNKYLLHMVDTKRIKRLSDYIFNSKKKRKNNIKYNSFTYLQNCHFILGNEILIDAMNIFNKVTNYKFTDLKREMKKSTRKLYIELYKQEVHKKKKYKKKIIQEILSKEPLITFGHFHYLTSKPFATILSNSNYSKQKKINKKVKCIYENMIIFICRFLISKTFCDHSTIFNIYSKIDNTYDANTSIFLKKNRFKLLILNKTSKPITAPRKSKTRKYNRDNYTYNDISHKMKKKIHIRKKNFSSYSYPFLKLHLKRRKLSYNNKISKELEKMVINKYIQEKNKKIFYRISLIDLSIKPISKIDYWVKQMSDIISTYKEFCVN